MKELLHDESLRKSGSIVEVKGHKERGQLFHRRQPDQVLRPEARDHAFAAFGRAHRRGAGGAGLQQRADHQSARVQSRLKPKKGSGAVQTNVDLQQLVAGAGDAIMVADAQGAITLWNAAAERIFGYAEAEALGKSLDLIIPERQRGRHWDGYQKTMDTGITKYGADLLRVPALHKDGHTLSIAFTVSMLFSEDRKVTGIVAIVRDETARFAEERKLRARLVEVEARSKETQ
jgi:PAS domain S-box-containing protein